MRAGDLRNPITIQVLTGGIWVDFCKTKAKAEDLSNGVPGQHGEDKGNFRFTIRFRPGITSAMRVVFNGNTYGVSNVVDVEGRKRTLEVYGSKEMLMPQPHMLQTAEIFPAIYGTFGIEYGQPFTTSCRIETSRKRDDQGNNSEIIAFDSPGFFPTGTNIGPDYRVVCDGITFTVVLVKPALEITTISHVEVVLR